MVEKDPSLSQKVLKLLVILSKSQLCEKKRFKLSLTKTKQGNRLDISVAFCLSETSLESRMSKLLATEQQQVSH